MVAAFEQLAREREAGAVTADSGGELFVIGAVGAVREAGALRCLIQCAARAGLGGRGAPARGGRLIGRR